MFNFNSETDRISKMLNDNANTSEIEFLENEIEEFLTSKKRLDIINAQNYLVGKHDILKRKRTVIGQNGHLEEVLNLPNNKIVDNQYCKMVEQKTSYLLSKKITFEIENKEYSKNIENVMNNKFFKLIKNVGEEAINCGISFVYLFLDENKKICFKKLNSANVLPFWADEEHTLLDILINIYQQEIYIKGNKKYLTKVEVYDKKRIRYFSYSNNRLHFESEKPYIVKDEKLKYSWGKVPIIAFKSNSREIPLLNKVKSLQDSLNLLRSDFLNNMQEDARNTILILKNYDGVNLSEFRKNLSEYGVVKVKTVDGSNGGVETLKIEVDSNNYQLIIDMMKKAIIENAKGYDCKDERMNNNPNRLNIQSMYSDIDLDANSMELEFKSSFEDLFYFVNVYFELLGTGSFFNEKVEIIFNKDQLINESEVIENCAKSYGIVSTETVIKNHPWVDNLINELKLIASENEDTIKRVDGYGK